MQLGYTVKMGSSDGFILNIASKTFGGPWKSLPGSLEEFI